VPGSPLTATAHIVVPGDTDITKATKIAQAICVACNGTVTGGTCATITASPPTIFSCPTQNIFGTLSGASLNVNSPTGLNAVLCTESTCETETMIASSPANMNILTAGRLSWTVTEGNLVITVNEGPPVRSVSISTGGKTEWQIMTDAAAALNGLSLGINA